MIFQVHLIFHQAQRSGAPIFQIRLEFHQAQRFGAATFQVRLKFYLAQRFRAAILQIRLDFQEAPRFSESAKIFCQKFSSQSKLFLSLSHFPKKDMQEVKCNVRTKEQEQKQKSQSKAKKKSCVFLSSSRKIPFVKRM